MAQAGSGAIYRIDAPSEDEADAKAADEIIEFNGGNAPDATGKMVATGFRMIRDVSPHPNPKRSLTKWQDNLLGTMEVTITGHFVQHDATAGPTQFFDWQKEAATNAALPFGQFGIRVGDFAADVLTLNPTATQGYILVDVQVNDAESPRDEVSFIAIFIRNGTIPA